MTSDQTELPGWTLISQDGAWGGWSGWSADARTAGETRRVESRVVVDGYYALCYLTRNTSQVREYRSYSVGGNYKGYGLSSAYGEFNYSGWYADAAWWNSRETVAQGAYVNWASNTAGYNKGNGTGYRGDNSEIVFKGAEVNHTEYRFQDYVAKNTFERWSEWSQWSDMQLLEDENHRVEFRTVYRFTLK